MNVLFLMTLCIVSINVRGLTSVDKFDKLKELCKKADVILLQETFWKDEMMDSLKEDGKEKCIIIMEKGERERSCCFM